MTFDTCPQTPQKEVFTENNRNIAFKKIRTGQFNFHLGALLFAPIMNKMSEKGLGFIRQFLVSILLGCHNIEQNKMLNYKSLEQLIGQAYKTLRTQRTLLKESATLHNIEQVLKFNADLLEVNKQSDFYYDPHTKHYTGQLKTLMTWCPSVRLADKGINMDYIHTTAGHPVYFNTTDNFYDLRERFAFNVKHFKSLCGFDQKQVLTMVVDRGIYSLKTFKDIINDPDMHIITWEKDYKKDKWDDNVTCQTGSIIKVKNKKGDHKLVHYRYQERTWEKESGIKQIIVRIYTDNKNWKVKMELSIITDDKDRNTNESIVLMLTRWVQENDFKYMIKHFGLNQITSYAFTDYRALRDKLEDKLYICTHHKSLTKEINKVRAKFKTALLGKHNFDIKYGNIEQEKLPKKQRERKANIATKVNTLCETLTKLEKERSETPKFQNSLPNVVYDVAIYQL